MAGKVMTSTNSFNDNRGQRSENDHNHILANNSFLLDLYQMTPLKNVTSIIINDYGEDIEDDNATDTDYEPYSDRPETYIVPLVFFIIFIIGVLGNGTLIGILVRHKSMRNVPNLYICSLAVGDLLVIFFCVPFTSTVYTVESWPYGLIVCKFSEFIKDVSIGVSVFTLTALSADRYFAIVDPMSKLQGRRATRYTILTIAGIWVISLLIGLPSLVFPYIREISYPTHTILVCYPFPPSLIDAYPYYPKVVIMFKFLFFYAVPLILIASFYVIMARHLILSTRNMPGEAQGQARQIQSRKKVAVQVLSFVIIFALCFFPSHFFFLWFYFDPDSEDNYNELWHVVRIVGFCLSFINSCLNPITLYCITGAFRKHFNRHLFCCLCDSEGRPRSYCYCPCLSDSIPTRPYMTNTTSNGERNRNGILGKSSKVDHSIVACGKSWNVARANANSKISDDHGTRQQNQSPPTPIPSTEVINTEKITSDINRRNNILLENNHHHNSENSVNNRVENDVVNVNNSINSHIIIAPTHSNISGSLKRIDNSPIENINKSAITDTTINSAE